MKTKRTDSPIAKSRVRRLTEAQLDDLWEKYNCDGICGHWFKWDTFPKFDAEELIDSGCVTDSGREASLLRGDPPTDEELDDWIDLITEGDVDFDIVPTFVIAPIEDKLGNPVLALILRTGYSFSMIETWLEGVFESNEAALDHMKRTGYIRMLS